MFLILFSGLTLFYYNKQHHLLFLAKPLPKDYKFKFSHPFKEFIFQSDDHSELHAILFSCKNPKGAVAYFHGQNENIQTNSNLIAHIFLRRGYDVMIMDYREFGKSTGTLTEHIFLEDALTPYDFLKEHYGEERLIVYGYSLGTGVATYVASKKQPKILLLEAPYYNMIDQACYMKPFLPRFLVKWLLRYPLRTDKYIQDVKSKTFIFHGTEDEIVPFASGLKLHESVKETHDIEFTRIEGGTHHSLKYHPDYHYILDQIL
ncbi:MAG: alpha/beta hydrolase [Simkaniaceae bacterium]|nr:alpha/beta hydrolase [Simkaniaceae bacterium]